MAKQESPTDKLKGALETNDSKIKPGMTLSSLLRTDTIRRKFEEVLGKKAPGFMSSILSAVAANKALQTSDPMSVISAAAIAASLDLPINSSLGFAHIVPYSGVAQFQIGWKGFVQLGMRSGQYKTMNATEIYEGEIVSHDRLTGRLEFDESKRVSDKIVGYAFFFQLTNGYEKTVYWTKEKCQAHGKRYSKSYAKGSGQWVENFDGMSLKTVVKNGLSKWGILSIEMQKALEVDQATIDESGSASVYPDAIETTAAPTLEDKPFLEEEKKA